MRSAEKDLYRTLGVARDASADAIKKAYRQIARENHPDVNPGDHAAEERFKSASEAYEILSDATKRNNYDEFGEAAMNPANHRLVRCMLFVEFLIFIRLGSNIDATPFYIRKSLNICLIYFSG